MKLPSIDSFVAIGLLLLSNSFQPALAASPSPEHSASQVFPWLTRCRDASIEFFFGRHPSKADDLQPKSPPTRVQHAHELVLRFSVTEPHEELALSRAAAQLFLDVWAFTGSFVDIRLHTTDVRPLLSLLPDSLGASHSVLIPDLSTAVHHTLPDLPASGSTSPEALSKLLPLAMIYEDNLFFQDYQPLSVIVQWMRLLQTMFPTYVEYLVIGKSFEGRDIPALRIGTSGRRENMRPRKTIVLTGGLHAREWISTSTVNYVAWSFITLFEKDSMVTKLLDEFDFVFIPAMNPDGIEYTWHVDRLWRKSRQQTGLRFCRGLDLDRAFGFEWDNSSVGNDPCSESYSGESPFQAQEAMELAKWARNETLHNVRFVGLLDLHSYSQQVLFPYSYSCSFDPPNLENLEELAAGITKAIRLSNGESYSVASACEGAASSFSLRGEQQDLGRMESGGGSAIDWFYHEMRAHFSYQIKLRDTGSYGFLLPKEHIIPTGEEMLNAVKYFGDYLLGNNGIERWLPKEGPETPAWSATELKHRRKLRTLAPS